MLSALTLEETRPSALRTTLSFTAVLRGFLTFVRTPGTRVPTLLACASFAGQFAFISGSPYVLIDGYGVPAEHYGFYFGSTAVMLMVGSLTSGQLVKRGFTPRVLLGVGAALLCTGGVLLPILVRIPALGVAGLMGPMMIYFIGIGFVGPNATAIAMAPVPEIAGTASALIGFLQMAAGALSGYVATRVGGKDPATLGLITGAMGVFAALLVAVTLVQVGRGRRADRRRVA